MTLSLVLVDYAERRCRRIWRMVSVMSVATLNVRDHVVCERSAANGAHAVIVAVGSGVSGRGHVDLLSNPFAKFARIRDAGVAGGVGIETMAR
jgi:hypothetical protein